MKIIYSGFDSLYFSMQGTLLPAALKHFERIKEQAVREKNDVAFSVPHHSTRYCMKPAGKKGGYAYIIETGLVGSSLAFKTSLKRDEHNGFVEISSASLLAHGWKDAVARGFHLSRTYEEKLLL